MTPTRTNFLNDGRGFQSEIIATSQGYRNAGIATLAKVDPPVRVLGGGKFRKVIFMANPFCDFHGAWTAHHGRSLCIEAKAIDEGRLSVGGSGKFTESQWTAMKAWRRAGAACAVLWRRKGEVRLFTAERLLEEERLGSKSVVFDSGLPVGRGMGTIIWDFLPVLEAQIWPSKIS